MPTPMKLKQIELFGGRVLTVGDGAQYSTITAALAAASSGDTILVGPGTYSEQITGVSGVCLKGCGCSADPTVSTVISQSFSSDGSVITAPTSGEFWVCDCYISGTHQTTLNIRGVTNPGTGGSIELIDCYVNLQSVSGFGGTVDEFNLTIIYDEDFVP